MNILPIHLNFRLFLFHINQPLRPDEIERQEKRKEQNKKAARKFREKRKREQQ